jgi:hypothetical protein
VTDTDLPTIIPYVALAIATIIALIVTVTVLIFTVRIKVSLEFKDQIRLWVSFLGIRYTILPSKPKKYKISNYTPEKIAKRDRKAAEIAAKKAEAEAKRKAEKAAKKRKKKAMDTKLTGAQKRAQLREQLAKWPAVDDSFDLLLSILETLFTTFLGRFHFHFTRVRIAVGSENAARTALLTTTIASAIEPTLYFIARHSNLHVSRNADICVYPDFLSEDIKFDVKLAFSMSLGSFLWVVLRTTVPGVVGWFRIQPTPPDKASHAIPQAGGSSSDRPAEQNKQK